MSPQVPLVALDGVGEGVPVVEDLPLPGLAQVGRDHPGLDRDGPLHDLPELIGAGIQGGRRIGFDDLEYPLVLDETGLDRFGETGGDVIGAEPSEHVEVLDHGDRRVEGAHQVLALGGVDARLASHRGIDHRGHGGGDLQHVHASQPGSGHETGQVRRGAASEPHEKVGAADLGLPGHLPQETGHLRGLGLLTVGHLGQERLPAVGGKLLTHLLCDAAQGGLVDHHDAPHPSGHVVGDAAQQPAAHQYLVAAGGGGDRDDGGAHAVSFGGSSRIRSWMRRARAAGGWRCVSTTQRATSR